MTKAAGTTTKHGGPGRGQGRKPVKQGEETVTVSLRVTVAQREKLARLGGAEWVRGKIDRAKEPNVEVRGDARLHRAASPAPKC